MELLIKAREPVPFRPGAYRKGDVVEVRADGAFYGLKEGLPDFVVVKIPGVLMAAAREYARTWKAEILFQVVGANVAIDGYRLRIYTYNVSASGLGGVTRDQVESFINSWGGTVFSVDENEVIFDITITAAVASAGYWDIDVGDVIFTEVSYDEGTGVHVIDADYTALGNNPSYVETFVENKALSIVSHSDGVIRFEIGRDLVRAEFEEDIARASLKMIERRRWHIDPTVVDTIIGQGGDFEATPAQLLNYLQDRIAE